MATSHNRPSEQQWPNITASGAEWQEVNSRKTKRNSPENQHRNVRQKSMYNYFNITEKTNTTNRFQALEQSEETSMDRNQIADTPKVIKPPPIFVPNVQNIQKMTELLDTSVTKQYDLKLVGSDQIKIQFTISENYSKAIQLFKEKDVQFHTYQPREQRNYRVILRGLHPNTNIEELTAEIEEKGHKVHSVNPMLHRVTKTPLPLFHIALQPQQNNKGIYEIIYLQRQKISFEPPYQKREVVQCIRCQRYGHTKSYCTRQPRCVKCSQNHLTKECTKDKNVEPTCVLCDDKHPANYKGCTVYKEIQKRKFPPLRPKILPREVKNQDTAQQPYRLIHPGLTFAQAAKEKSQQVQDDHNSQSNIVNAGLTNILEQMMARMDRMMERVDKLLELIITLVSKKP